MKYLAHSVKVIPRFRKLLKDVASDSEILSLAKHPVDTFFEKGCTITAALE